MNIPEHKCTGDLEIGGFVFLWCRCNLLFIAKTPKKARRKFRQHRRQVNAAGGRFAEPFPY